MALYLVKSDKQSNTSWLNSVRATSVIPSCFCFRVRKWPCSFSSMSSFQPSERHVRSLFCLMTLSSFIMIWGLTIDQLMSSSCKVVEVSTYSISLSKELSLWCTCVSENRLILEPLFKASSSWLTKPELILQSINFSSSIWKGSYLVNRKDILSIQS